MDEMAKSLTPLTGLTRLTLANNIDFQERVFSQEVVPLFPGIPESGIVWHREA